MSIAKQFNKVIRKELRVHAAWMPIANNFKIGDYGLIDNGVFVRRGNIKTDFNIDAAVNTSPNASIDFKSTGTSVVKLVAGAQVNVIPAGAVNAEVKVSITKNKSFIIKSPSIKVTEIISLDPLAATLASTPGWRSEYKVVCKILNAQNALVISSRDSNTELSFTGDASALEKLDLGNAGLTMSFTKAVGLDIQGEHGVIGLGLFTVDGSGQMNAVRGKAKATKAKARVLNEVDLEDDM